MAKRRTRTQTVTKTVVARQPPPTIRVAMPAGLSKVKKAGRKHYRRARTGFGNLFSSSTPQMTAIAGAGILGLLQKNGIKIPKLVDSLSTAANAGIIAYGLGKIFKSTTLDHSATGCLSVALWAFASDTPIQGDYVMGTGVVYGDDDVYDYAQ